jgi:hypothetical protein
MRRLRSRGGRADMKALARRMEAIAAFVVVLVLAITPPAGAVPPPVSVVMAEPFQGGAIVVERTAGETAGQPDRWRMNQDIWLQNTGGSTLVLDEITIAYSGGSDPPDITVPAASFNAIADDPMNLNQIPAGDTSRVRVPEERVHAFPVANSVSVSITFDGFDPIVVSRDSPSTSAMGHSGASRSLVPRKTSRPANTGRMAPVTSSATTTATSGGSGSPRTGASAAGMARAGRSSPTIPDCSATATGTMTI